MGILSWIGTALVAILKVIAYVIAAVLGVIAAALFWVWGLICVCAVVLVPVAIIGGGVALGLWLAG